MDTGSQKIIVKGFNRHESDNYDAYFWVITLISFALTTFSWLFSENYIDYDSVTRSLMCAEWLKNPFWITSPNEVTWVFGPLHCYLGSVPILLGMNPDDGVRLVSAIFGFLTFIFVVKSSIQHFDRQAGLVSGILLMTNSLWIKHCGIANSEVLAAFFFVASFYFITKFVKSRAKFDLIVASAMMVLSTMTRWEMWILNLGITFYLFANIRSKREMFNVGLFHLALSYSFCLMWLIGNQIEYSDPLYFLRSGTQTLEADTIVANIRDRGAIGNVLYNLAFWPAVLASTIGLSIFPALWSFQRRLVKFNVIMPFLFVITAFCFFYFYAFIYPGERYPIARFTYSITPILLILASGHIGAWLNEVNVNYRTGIVILTLLGAVLHLPVLQALTNVESNRWSDSFKSLAPISRVEAEVRTIDTICDSLLNSGKTISLDYRHSPQRYIYLRNYNSDSQLVPIRSGEVRYCDTNSILNKSDFELLHRSSPYLKGCEFQLTKRRILCNNCELSVRFQSGEYVLAEVKKP